MHYSQGLHKSMFKCQLSFVISEISGDQNTAAHVYTLVVHYLKSHTQHKQGKEQRTRVVNSLCQCNVLSLVGKPQVKRELGKQRRS